VICAYDLLARGYERRAPCAQALQADLDACKACPCSRCGWKHGLTGTPYMRLDSYLIIATCPRCKWNEEH